MSSTYLDDPEFTTCVQCTRDVPREAINTCQVCGMDGLCVDCLYAHNCPGECDQ